MALSYLDWQTDLEDAIAAHIEDTLVTEDVSVLIESEIPRPLPGPVITLAQVGGDRQPTGGMQHTGDSYQGYFEIANFLITVNTDTGTGEKTVRNKVAAELKSLCFGQSLHLLKASADAIDIMLTDGASVSGTFENTIIWQKQFNLYMRVIVEFPSLVL